MHSGMCSLAASGEENLYDVMAMDFLGTLSMARSDWLAVCDECLVTVAIAF